MCLWDVRTNADAVLLLYLLQSADSLEMTFMEISFRYLLFE